uniref:Immunoglobulin domain-containing protein n=1 Tax=Scleropages formosus TaxID=113540 RepID=A0A8C9RYA7_SCLFO
MTDVLERGLGRHNVQFSNHNVFSFRPSALVLLLLLYIFFFLLAANKGVWTESWFTADRGGSVTIPCHYDKKYKNSTKNWCRGYIWSSCSTMVCTDSPRSEDEVSIADDPDQLVFNVSMKNLRQMDSDWYWCGIDGLSLTQKSAPLYLLVTGGMVIIHLHFTFTFIHLAEAFLHVSILPPSPSTLLIILLFVGFLLLLLVAFVMKTWILRNKPSETSCIKQFFFYHSISKDK